MELMKQIHLFKKGFVIFLKGATFSDFVETRLSNYKPLAIWIRFPLFWRIFFQLGSNLIKQCTVWKKSLSANARKSANGRKSVLLRLNFNSHWHSDIWEINHQFCEEKWSTPLKSEDLRTIPDFCKKLKKTKKKGIFKLRSFAHEVKKR